MAPLGAHCSYQFGNNLDWVDIVHGLIEGHITTNIVRDTSWSDQLCRDKKQYKLCENGSSEDILPRCDKQNIFWKVSDQWCGSEELVLNNNQGLFSLVLNKYAVNFLHQWLKARLQCLQHISYGVTAVLHWGMDISSGCWCFPSPHPTPYPALVIQVTCSLQQWAAGPGGH